MKTLARYLKIYFMIISQYIKTRLQYRADFIIGTIGMVFANASNLVVIWLIFGSVPSIKGWTYYELVFMTGFFYMALTPQQLFFDTFWNLGWQLQSGQFIKYYFRPLNMLFYYASQSFDLKGLAQLGIGFGMLAVSGSRLGIDWSLPRVLLLVVNWMSASLIMIAIVIGTLSSSFWIINSMSLTGTIMTVREFGRYPLDIFSKSFRWVFTFIAPIGFLAFYPCQMLLKPWPSVSPAAWFSPVAGFLSFVIACAIWRKGVKSYSGTGS
jgi:ABC-2 type transport system permease protein